MRHPTDADEFLEVPGDELRAIAGDNSRLLLHELLTPSLDDDFNVGFGHCFTYLPMDYVSTAAVQETALEIERAADIEVSDINMPMLMGP